MLTETGPQRAQRRAAVKGLTVGAPVRITHPGYGFNAPNAAENRPRRDPATYAGPGGATPLERVDRLARYLLQREVATHVRQGGDWQPSARQFRRADHKARHAAAPFGPKSPDYVPPTRGRRADLVIVDDPAPAVVRQDDPEFVPKVVTALLDPANEVKPERDRSTPYRGFRVVDRRGEHR